MRALRQFSAVTELNLRALPQRLGASLVVVLGIAGVVGVLVSVLAMAVGFQRAAAGTGSPDRAIVISSGALSEMMSSVPRDAVPNLLGLPGVARDAQGRPVGEAEVLAQIQVPRRGSGTRMNLTLRGTGAIAADLRPEIRLIAGRMFQPGVHELIVGRNAEQQYAGLELGNRLSFQNGEWTVVGIFATAHPSLLDSELLADAPTLLSAYQRNWFQSVTLRLASADSLARIQAAVAADPTLRVDVHRESEYAATQSRFLSRLLSVIAYFIGGMMAAGALFGALNTLYAAVSARSLEIATLRGIGFGATSVVVSVLVEALLLALAGALLGAGCAWLIFNGHVTSMFGAGLATQMAFTMAVTPGLIALGVVWGCIIGLAGGLPPALRAARLTVADALRSV